MSYKPDDATLTAYLYNDLSKEEHKKVKVYLEDNPDVKEELEQIRSMQKVLGTIPDREVVPPEFVIDNETKSKVHLTRTGYTGNFLRASLSIAASLILIILTGYLTGLNMSIGGNGLQLSFGEKEPAPIQNNPEQMKIWMEAALAQNNQNLIGKISEIEGKLVSQANEQEEKILNTKARINQDLIDRYVAQLKQENEDMILNLIEASSSSQRQYLDDLMVDFAKFVDIQRQADLELIQTNFNRLADDTELSQKETKQILSSIISTVSEQAEKHW